MPMEVGYYMMVRLHGPVESPPLVVGIHPLQIQLLGYQREIVFDLLR